MKFSKNELIKQVMKLESLLKAGNIPYCASYTNI